LWNNLQRQLDEKTARVECRSDEKLQLLLHDRKGNSSYAQTWSYTTRNNYVTLPCYNIFPRTPHYRIVSWIFTQRTRNYPIRLTDRNGKRNRQLSLVPCPSKGQKKISAKNWPLLCARNLYWYLKKLYCIFAFETDCRSFFCLWASKDHFIAIIFNINSFLKKILFH
jgi:hypothetical protein